MDQIQGVLGISVAAFPKLTNTKTLPFVSCLLVVVNERMSESIKFKAAYGDTDSDVELSRMPGGYYHIYIDRYFKGQVVLRQGIWDVCPQHDHYFTIDDMDVIRDIVTEYEAGR